MNPVSGANHQWQSGIHPPPSLSSAQKSVESGLKSPESVASQNTVSKELANKTSPLNDDKKSAILNILGKIGKGLVGVPTTLILIAIGVPTFIVLSGPAALISHLIGKYKKPSTDTDNMVIQQQRGPSLTGAVIGVAIAALPLWGAANILKWIGKDLNMDKNTQPIN